MADDRPWWSRYAPRIIKANGDAAEAPRPRRRKVQPLASEPGAGAITVAVSVEGEPPQLVKVNPPMKGSAEHE